MAQFRVDADNDTFKEPKLAKVHLEADMNAELLETLLDEVEYGT